MNQNAEAACLGVEFLARCLLGGTMYSREYIYEIRAVRGAL